MHATKFGVVAYSQENDRGQYVALDVSLQKTAVCVLNVSGRVLVEADVPSEPGMDARHAHAALSVRPSKSDRNDARGLAEMVRMGWYREVQVKSLAAHERMALLGVRRRLVDMRVEIDGQIRGILKLAWS
jgi:hypothetical protein